jgi:hypothetical protein
MHRLRFSRVAVVVLAIAALAACSNSAGSHGSYAAGDPNLAASNPGGGPIDPFLADGKAVTQALDDIAQRSGRPMRITSISADRINGLMVDVQEPAHHMNVDHYVVGPDGTISGPTPVKLMSLDGGPITVQKVDARAFSPSAVAFADLAATAKAAIAKSGYSDARVTEWEIDGIGPDDRRFIYLESARARPSAEISPQLKIVRMSF